MRNLFSILLFFLFINSAYAHGFGGGAISPLSIGGVGIGAQGNGIYSGYTMAGGDEFNSSLNVVNIATPLNRYFPTIDYENGTRGTTGSLTKTYDSDPYNPGHQDSNMGVALGGNVMYQSNSILTLAARLENSTETGNIGSGRTVVDAMIHTAGYLTFSSPAIVEARVLFSASPPSGWHPTFWVHGAEPVTGVGQEYDYEANTYNGQTPTAFALNYNQYSGAPTCSNGNQNAFSGFDNSWHTVTMVLTAVSNAVYVDGAQVGSITCDTTSGQSVYQIFFTNHIINPNTIGQWTSTPQNYQVDWYRVWIPNAQYPAKIISSTQNLPNIQVNYNTSMSYTFTSAATLWGAGVTDYCQAIPFEDYEPGCSAAFNCGYSQFPSGLSYNSGTRVLTGVTTDKEPGRINTACMPAWQSGGGVGYTARGYIDVGPTISPTSISYSNGTGSFNVYTMGNAGDLVPKSMTVTGLPSGLTFNASTFLITGTAVTGSYTITIGVTNSSGQAVSNSSISLTVGS